MIGNFNNQTSAYLNAVDKTGLEVTLSGVNGNGTVILGKYTGEPQPVGFSSGIIKGGTVKPAVKFVDIRVEGNTGGTVRVTVHYADQEVSNINVDSLFLAYFNENKWHKCEHSAVSSDNKTVSGDIPVYSLTGTVVGLGGDRLNLRLLLPRLI